MKSVEYLELNSDQWKAEVLVIDNNSTDNSLAYLSGRFPGVRFQQSGENLGFGKANNRLLEIADGEYVLFLNPDTIIPEDCLLNNLVFIRSQANAGATGIRMIDGSGKFLPESKRGFPGIWNSVTKMTGMASFFPASRIFAGYYQGHLDNHKSHEVSILSGAYLMVRTDVLRKLSGFDEQFFMYAEDIDLSYRITKEGNKNYYFAETTIIHFKGESTRKDKKYVRQFYLAMIQFVRKHYTGKIGSFYIRLLETGIRLKAGISKPADQNSVQKRPEIVKTFLEGDEESCSRLRPMLQNDSQSQLRRLVTDKNSANEIIYCIGKEFLYKDLIGKMQTDKPHSKKIFHPGAGAIIGSDSKIEPGTITILL